MELLDGKTEVMFSFFEVIEEGSSTYRTREHAMDAVVPASYLVEMARRHSITDLKMIEDGTRYFEREVTAGPPAATGKKRLKRLMITEVEGRRPEPQDYLRLAEMIGLDRGQELLDSMRLAEADAIYAAADFGPWKVEGFSDWQDSGADAFEGYVALKDRTGATRNMDIRITFKEGSSMSLRGALEFELPPGPDGRSLSSADARNAIGRMPEDMALDRADLEELYSQGECHVFAAACHLTHGGDFLVAYDQEKIHFETEDDEIYEVLHVFARLEGPQGPVLRDIFGDRPDDEAALADEVADRFGTSSRDVTFEAVDAHELLAMIDDEEAFLADALSIDPPESVMDHDERPLQRVFPSDLANALALEDVTAAPGVRAEPMAVSEPEAPGF